MVALKRLLPHLAEDASFIKSFVREAKLASLLNHVNIVQIYELGRVGTEYFISMEYIDGRDLRRILRHARKVTGPPPINITVGLMIQLCDALDYAHNRVDEDGHPLGLVHRDISPSNLIVTSAGHLKIIDFGIAKAQSSQLRTHTGRVKGKLAYMAPEAVSGSRDLDARSDIWACGVILHELLTARPLFASKNEYQTLLKVQRGDIIPPSTFNHACPTELDTIVFRALARDADQRFPNAAELRDALIKLKVDHALQTGYREISSWLDWAFGLEPPASFSTSPDSSGVSSPETPRNAHHHKTPRPTRSTDEEEAVEVVWGGGNVESEDGPVVLEDVPDVSEKHQRPKVDDGKFDNIPTPLPVEGTMPSIYGSDQIVVVDPESSGATSSGAPGAGSERVRAQRATTQHTIPRKPTGVHPVVQPIDSPQLSERMAAQRARQSTAPGVEAPARPHSPSEPSGSSSEPSRARSPSDQSRARSSSDQLRANTLGGPRARTSSGPLRVPTLTDPPRPRPSSDRIPTAPGVLESAIAASANDIVPASPIADEDTPTLSPSSQVTPLPVVRFAKSTTAPPPTKTASPPAIARSGSHVTPLPVPHASLTGPHAAQTGPHVSRTGGHAIPRATSPADSLSKPLSNIRIGESIAARNASGSKWLVLLGLVVVGGGATGYVMMARNKDRSGQREAPPTPVRDTGTVRFMLEPADAEIKIAGAPVHAGSPWSSELPAGVHTIEIHRQGYKSWLTSIELSANETQTLRVVLEPLTSVLADASLTVTTTPAGLEVLIDGEVQAQRTPLKMTLKPGAHRIAVRQDGVEVWHQQLTAESSSNYEFNPSFTADKQRERAQRSSRSTTSATPSSGRSEIHAEKLGTSAPHGAGHAPPPASSPSAAGSTGPDATGSAAAAPSAAAATTPAPTTPAITQPIPAPATATTPTTSAAPKQAPAVAAPKQITAPVPPTPVAPAPVRHSSTPPIVPPVAVKKIAGDPPSIAKYRNMELPASVAAKLCIDETGKVTSANMMTRLERRIANDITAELRDWRYAPYKIKGAPSPACFVVTLRTK